MWIRHTFVVTLCIYSLSYAMPNQTPDIDMCSSDSPGYRFCESELALCKNEPNTAKGYECYCREGEVKTGGLCEDSSEVDPSTNSITEFTSITSLSSSLLSTSGTHNTTIETLNDSSEPIYLSSSFEPPALTTSFDYDSSTNFVSEVQDADECLKHHCTENATCIKLSQGFTCKCKIGFVPQKKHFAAKSHCLKDCTLAGCEDICKLIKCFLKKEKEGYRNTSTLVYFEKHSAGWPTESIIVCGILLSLLLISVAGTAYLFQRYRKLVKRQQYEEKQIVYQKMDKGALCSESRDNLVFKGVGYI